MKESRNIFGWLGMKQEKLVIEDAARHVEVTYETVEWFKKAISALIAGDIGKRTEAIEKVRECEHHADELRKKMVNELSEGILVPPDREDLMHFVKSLDRIADWTNGAARILGFIEHKLPENVLKNISTATELIFNSISMLREAIESLTKNDLKKALGDCDEVDRIEHDADDQKRLLIEAIIHAKLEPTNLLLTYQLAEYLEGVTDKIEDAADFIKVVAIKSK
ncbi:MAG: hypothetical protein AMJ78_02045 [Omnitrophica WOR_2 bacterium SM23_29]|nr:MAG: hypothetical protein AMJ78_02045 [Omnitrophica WOR_2 bacterium SM23_29]